MKRFDGKLAIVTGAARGIGAAIARRLAHEGARLAMVDLDASALEETARSIREAGGRVEAKVADVRDRASVERVVSGCLAQGGSIDVLVNNAGVIRDGYISDLTDEDWDQVLDVNLKAAFLFCRAVSSAMRERRSGRIVNIASRAWLGNPGQCNYSASKGGLVSLTRALALELAKFGVGVNAVAPGLIDTPMTRALPEKARERLIRAQPGGAMGTVEDIAAAVAFLASDEARFVTGQVLPVDGGKSCGLAWS